MPGNWTEDKFVLGRRDFLRMMGAAGVSLSPLVTALPAGAQQAALKNGGVMVSGISGDISNLMSGLGSEVEKIQISGQIFDTLVEVGADYKVRGSLAHDWEVSDDGLSYTFHLRDGVTWHDGAPFTSEDVKFSMLEINSQYNPLARRALSEVREIETPDPLTVIVHMKSPDPAMFPWAFSQPNYAQIFPKHIFEGTDARTNPAAFAPIGTGPFMYREWARGSHITLDRNPNYFLSDQLFLDRVIFRIIPDPGTRQLALERGEIDYINNTALPAASVEALADNPDIEIIPTLPTHFGLIHMWMNMREGPLAAKEVRHAIAHGFDRQRIVDLALGGRGRPGTAPTRSDTPNFYTPDVRRYEFDPAKANALLDAAGFPRGANGERFKLRLSYMVTGEGGALQSAAEIMREQLNAVGVSIQLIPSDAQTYTAAGQQWDFDLSFGSYGTGPDPKIGINRFYLTANQIKGQWANISGYSNALVDELLTRADVEMKEETRWDLYHQAQRQIVEDLPGIWMWEPFYPIAVRKGLTGLPAGALNGEGFKNVGWLA